MSSPRTAQPSQRRSASRGQRLSQRRPARPAPQTPSTRPASLRPSTPAQELICSGIGLTLKTGLALVAVVSLVRLGGAYRERLDRYGEITAVLNIQQAKLNKAQQRFDNLFTTGGEQRLIQEQDQWIAPNRMRVVWKQPQPQGTDPFPTVEQGPSSSEKPQAAR
ncbi:hypothetical protein [Synechococcus sp. CBW1107]|uniref:hypothetical protein n=1 Tax=Synechococcus sp. CBW1107 TaxID=2789857 RepID=UPI002AD53B54|nr:hypothetical protein [Synechococcus sp. CBW1107]CAK6691857.1 hypothetical protein MNNICLKF_01106 [Synechococcus sp. CBW1107]